MRLKDYSTQIHSSFLHARASIISVVFRRPWQQLDFSRSKIENSNNKQRKLRKSSESCVEQTDLFAWRINEISLSLSLRRFDLIKFIKYSMD